MQYNSEANNQDLVSDVDFWTGVGDANAHTLAEKTRSMNYWWDLIDSWILEADERWHADDNNQTDMPSATAPLVEGQRDYGITAATYLEITSVQILDLNSNYLEIQYYPFDHPLLKRLRENRGDNGRPLRYTLRGSSILLDPKPSSSYCTLASGLRIFFTRPNTQFATTDTTKVPGFARQFHRMLSMGAAYDYLLKEDAGRASALLSQIYEMKADLQKFYGNRAKDDQPRLRLRPEQYNTRGRAQDPSMRNIRFN